MRGASSMSVGNAHSSTTISPQARADWPSASTRRNLRFGSRRWDYSNPCSNWRLRNFVATDVRRLTLHKPKPETRNPKSAKVPPPNLRRRGFSLRTHGPSYVPGRGQGWVHLQRHRVLRRERLPTRLLRRLESPVSVGTRSKLWPRPPSRANSATTPVCSAWERFRTRTTTNCSFTVARLLRPFRWSAFTFSLPPAGGCCHLHFGDASLKSQM